HAARDLIEGLVVAVNVVIGSDELRVSGKIRDRVGPVAGQAAKAARLEARVDITGDDLDGIAAGRNRSRLGVPGDRSGLEEVLHVGPIDASFGPAAQLEVVRGRGPARPAWHQPACAGVRAAPFPRTTSSWA